MPASRQRERRDRLAVDIVPVDRDTPHLFPASVQAYLPEKHRLVVVSF